MATIKAYTDLEQSKKLAEILPLESADMYYDRGGLPSLIDKYVTHESIENDKYHHLIPCWSLAALINLLPSSLKDEIGIEYGLSMNKEYIEYANYNFDLYGSYMHTCGNDNLVDACFEMILKLHELKIL